MLQLVPATPVMNASRLTACAWIVVILAWGGVAGGNFQYDNFANVLNDPATTNLSAPLDRVIGGIRPLTRLSYALSFRWSGERAGGWLLMNLCLHAVTVPGIAAILHLRFRNANAAVLVAVIVAAVPSHAIVIAYVSGRSIGLATCLA